MVERIILLKLKQPDTRAQVAELCARTLATLPALAELSVGLPADEASTKSWDVSLILRFATLDALSAALASATFSDFSAGALTEHAQVIKAWSFEHI
jgi:hypothetical protein